MILADTSAWVEYDRATGSVAEQRLRSLIDSDGPLAVTEPVMMEIMAGARSERRASELRRLLLRFELMSFDAVADFEAAAHIYRTCRGAETTPRGMIACMIAATAWRRAASVLSHDADLARVAQVIGLELDHGSLRP